MLRGHLKGHTDVRVPASVTGTQDVAINVSLRWDGSYVVNGDPFSRDDPDLPFVIRGLLGNPCGYEDVFHFRLCGGAEHVVHLGSR